MMNKKQILMDYLDSNLFTPIIHSPNVSCQIKYEITHIKFLLNQFCAEGIISYIWNTLANKDIELIISNRLIDEGFYSYPQIINEFKLKFTYDWLIS